MSLMTITGRLGRDAELKTLQSGTKVLSFSIADDIGWGDKKRTQWISCALFGDRAEKLAQYMTKSTLVECHGVPSVRAWKNKDGEPQAALELNVNEVKLHGGGSKDSGPVADKGRATRGSDDDDIPF